MKARRMVAALVFALVAGAWTSAQADGRCPDVGAGAGVGGVAGATAGTAVTGATGVAGGIGGAVAVDDPEPADLERARALAAEGRAALSAGDADVALARLEEAYGLSRDPVLLADVGLALHAKGRLDAAWRSLQRYRLEARSMYEASPGRIDAAMAELEPRLAGLVIEADAPGAELRVDGVLLARLPMERPIYLAAGDARVTVVVPGRGETDVEADLEAGAVARVEADLDELRPVAAVGGVAAGGAGLASDADLSEPEIEEEGVSPWLWVAGGVGVAVVAGAVVATVVHGNLSSDFDAMGCGGSTPGPQCESLDSDIGLASTLQIGGFILGGAALVGAGLIWALSGSTEEESLDCPTGPAIVAQPSVECSPLLGTDGFGATCGARF